jgi:pimeloyl-ACP methyl ester carboxylesterase
LAANRPKGLFAVDDLLASCLSKIIPERFYFDGANCRLSAIDFGTADKPSLVLVHGMRDHGLSLSGIAELLKADFHVIAIDLRGHGHSDNPGIYAMAQFVADLRALVLHCQLSAPVLVGHSLGGHIVSRYGMAYPAEVSQIILLDGMGPPRAPAAVDVDKQQLVWREQVEAMRVMSVDQKSMVDHTEAQQRLLRNNPRISPKLAQQIVEAGVEPHPAGGVRWRWDPAMSMVWQTFSMIDSEQQMRWLTCPVLIVTGDEALNYWVKAGLVVQADETLYQAELTRRLGLFKDARHVVIEQAGHMLHYDQPERLNRVLQEFLGAH